MVLLTDASALAQDEAFSDLIRSHLGVVAESAPRLFEEDLESVRDGFRRVSHGLLPVAAGVRGPNTASPMTHFYCPMVKGGGGDWLQDGELAKDALRNPYFGAEMLTCGKKVRQLAVGNSLSSRSVEPSGGR